MMRDQRESKVNLSAHFIRNVIAGGRLVDHPLGGENYIFKPADSMQFRLVDDKLNGHSTMVPGLSGRPAPPPATPPLASAR
jgi:hypothetical protein